MKPLKGSISVVLGNTQKVARECKGSRLHRISRKESATPEDTSGDVDVCFQRDRTENLSINIMKR